MKTLWFNRKKGTEDTPAPGADAVRENLTGAESAALLRSWGEEERKEAASGPVQEDFFTGRYETAERGNGITVHVPRTGQTSGLVVRQESDTWTCESQEIKGKCPIFTDKLEVRVPHEIYQSWHVLAKRHKDEWIAYLTGEIDETKAFYQVDGFYFPPQVASGGHCEPIQNSFEFRPRTIGTVHSHNVMAAFFSGTDLAHMNWPVELVINAKGEMATAVRTKFECGKVGRATDAKTVLIEVPPQVEDPNVALLKEALEQGKALTARGNVRGAEAAGGDRPDQR